MISVSEARTKLGSGASEPREGDIWVASFRGSDQARIRGSEGVMMCLRCMKLLCLSCMMSKGHYLCTHTHCKMNVTHSYVSEPRIRGSDPRLGSEARIFQHLCNVVDIGSDPRLGSSNTCAIGSDTK